MTLTILNWNLMILLKDNHTNKQKISGRFWCGFLPILMIQMLHGHIIFNISFIKTFSLIIPLNMAIWTADSLAQYTHKMENFPIKLWINSLKNLIKRWSSITKCFKQSSIWAWSFLCYHYDLELSMWPCTITHLELSHDLDFSGHQNIPYISN